MVYTRIKISKFNVSNNFPFLMFFNSQNLKTNGVYTPYWIWCADGVYTPYWIWCADGVYTHVFKAFKLSCKHGVDPVLSIMSMQSALLTFWLFIFTATRIDIRDWKRKGKKCRQIYMIQPLSNPNVKSQHVVKNCRMSYTSKK